MSLVARKPAFGIHDTNRAVQPQKMVRGLKFLIWEVLDGLHFLCSSSAALVAHMQKSVVFVCFYDAAHTINNEHSTMYFGSVFRFYSLNVSEKILSGPRFGINSRFTAGNAQKFKF